MKTCLIRLDASASVGYGHLMRCLALGEELRKTYELVFIIREDKSAELIENQGYQVKQIAHDADEEAALLLLARKFPDSIWIIDVKTQYTEGFLPELKKSSCILLLIENLSHNMDAADSVLFPAAHLDERILDPWLAKDQRHRVLSGWDWILLRDEILNVSPSKQTLSLAITTGGSDPNGVFFKIWELLKGTGIHATFLIGNSFAHRDRLPQADENLKIVDYEIEYVASAQYVISTFGVSVAECLFLGKPVISIAHSHENAEGSAILSERTPACIDLGYYEDLKQENLLKAIEKCQSSSQEIVSWLDKGPIDGKGARRVADWIRDKAVAC